jgi:ribosomal protein L37AE/L43A
MKLLDESIEMKEMDINTPAFEYKCPVCHRKKTFESQEMAWKCNLCNVALNFVSVIL